LGYRPDVIESFPEGTDPFKVKDHSGLDFAYGAGRVRKDNTITDVVAGTVTLTDDTTNYIEVTAAGVVSDNTTGFTSGQIPLYTAVTASGEITTVTDKRAFIGRTEIQKRGISFYIDGELSVDTGLAIFVVPLGLTLTIASVYVRVGTAPVDASLIVDVNKNGTTIFTTQGNRPTITTGNTSATSAAPDVTSITAADYITIDVDQVGSTTAGSDLSITINCEVA
jgi:hypothetical protein